MASDYCSHDNTKANGCNFHALLTLLFQTDLAAFTISSLCICWAALLPCLQFLEHLLGRIVILIDDSHNCHPANLTRLYIALLSFAKRSPPQAFSSATVTSLSVCSLICYSVCQQYLPVSKNLDQ